VTTEIRQRFPATIELSVAGLLLGLLWTIPLGVLAALRPRGIVDRISQALVEFGVAVPSFLLGVLLILFFYAGVQIAPSPVGELDISAVSPPRVTGLTLVDSLLAGQFGTFRSALEHLALPAITLAVTACPPILQLTRNAMIEVLRSDYIRSARALGLPQRTVRWYAFKNAMLPVSTMTAMTFGYLLGGTVLVEQVFSWPGIGLYAVQSLQQLDYAPVLGVVLLASAVYVFVYLLADLLAVVVDPRLREGD
jgi:ABC-type dipeptide/oligopeptide/nickel transport system permease component